ncbi:DUF4190 domain-containing protein [Pseudonocardia sp. GCM10023141]|uniref:DUF4190 domain-containing protein n=1 Tax=Pseudonocardia sp. GCM10023141 TaxID=3252653 RepID=UPI00360D3697
MPPMPGVPGQAPQWGPSHPVRPSPIQPYPGPIQQWGPPPAGLGYPPLGPQPRPTVNGLAVAALVVAIISLFPIAAVLAFVSLGQIRRNGQTGRAFAIAALVVSAVWVVVWALIVALITMLPASGATVTTSGYHAGDCVNRNSGSGSGTLPCAQPHDAEVFAVFSLPAGTYPGDPAVEDTVENACNERLDAYAPSAGTDTAIGLAAISPDAASWRRNDREVVCLATARNGKVTGSIRGR